jgi:hypothetical protein
MNYDIVGDIHGNAAKLISLLKALGYRDHGGVWRQAGHQVIFVGDFIDRGPRQLETLGIVRRMIDGGHALATMGNHELNAIAWYLPDPRSSGHHLRPRHGPVGEKNRRQHEGFLLEVEGRPEHDEWIDWFLTLPLWLELPGIRVVHACWHPEHMAWLAPRLLPGERLNADLVEAASRRNSPEYRAIECLLKGLEVELPSGHAFVDKDGHSRMNVRIKWWDQDAVTFRTAAILGDPTKERALPELAIPSSARISDVSRKPTFFGHYWLTGTPHLQSPRHVCVDYSAGKGGPLVAYRWQGEPDLRPEQFVAAQPQYTGVDLRRPSTDERHRY